MAEGTPTTETPDEFSFFKMAMDSSFVEKQKQLFNEFAERWKRQRAAARSASSNEVANFTWNVREYLAEEEMRGFANESTICYLCSGRFITRVYFGSSTFKQTSLRECSENTRFRYNTILGQFTIFLLVVTSQMLTVKRCHSN